MYLMLMYSMAPVVRIRGVMIKGSDEFVCTTIDFASTLRVIV